MSEKTASELSLSVSSSLTKMLCEHLITEGYKERDLEDLLDTPCSMLGHDDCRINLEAYHMLWSEAIKYTKDPALGLKLGSSIAQDSMGLVGHVFFNCKTLESAIHHYQRYYAVINEGIEVQFDSNEQFSTLSYHVDAGLPYCTQEMECTVSLASSRAKLFLRSGLDVEYVSFQHARPKYYSEYEKYFSCPIKFDSEDTGVCFRSSYLHYEIPRRSESLQRVLVSHLDGLMRKLSHRGRVSMQVAHLVRRKLSEEHLDADYVAAKLKISRNTLYRKLKKEGVSYHEIVDRVKAEQAIRYLEMEQYSLTELAFLLGFSELSAFSRAFKRWTGESPQHWRTQKK